jgi:predicted enzyme related to lactoylglutathione lyase
MALIERLDVVWYRVQSWDAMRAFYTTVLGLPVTAEDEEGLWLELAPGGVVRLGLAGITIEDLHGGAVPVFLVHDLPAVVSVLQEQGASVERLSATLDGSQGAFFFDPVGNRLQLLQAAPDAALPPADWDGTAPVPAGPPTDGLVTGIAFVWYLTPYPEWEQARRFYAETLALPQSYVSDTAPHWAIFQTGTTVQIALGTPEAGQLGPAGACVVVLEVSDMDEALARLRKHNVEHHEESDPGGRLVSFYDPDGNQLQFHWTRP